MGDLPKELKGNTAEKQAARLLAKGIWQGALTVRDVLELLHAKYERVIDAVPVAERIESKWAQLDIMHDLLEYTERETKAVPPPVPLRPSTPTIPDPMLLCEVTPLMWMLAGHMFSEMVVRYAQLLGDLPRTGIYMPETHVMRRTLWLFVKAILGVYGIRSTSPDYGKIVCALEALADNTPPPAPDLAGEEEEDDEDELE